MTLKEFLDICYFRVNLAYLPGMQVHEMNSENPSAIQYSSFVLSIITCVLGLVGNIIVIIMTGFVMKTHKSRIWFLNLAIADLLFLLILPLNAVSVLGANWPYGQHVCKMYNFLSIANMYASVFLITALTFERFLSVMAPIWHRRFYSTRVSYCTCAAIWVITTLCSIPAILYSNVPEYKGKAVCSLYEFDINELSLFKYKSSDFPHHYGLGFRYHMFWNAPPTLDEFDKYKCKNRFKVPSLHEKELKAWNSLQNSTFCYLVPLLVIGYFIPLCAILCSNVSIACKVRTSGTIRSSRLYGMVTAAIVAFIITRTPLVIGQIIILSSLQNLDYTLMAIIIILYPLLSSIAYINCCLNPIIYVFLGREVISTIRQFFRRIRHRNVTSSSSVPVTS